MTAVIVVSMRALASQAQKREPLVIVLRRGAVGTIRMIQELPRFWPTALVTMLGHCSQAIRVNVPRLLANLYCQ